MKILKPRDLMIGDTVHYKDNRFPFGDMQVIHKDDKGVTLARPYLQMSGKAATEEAWWSLDSEFEFVFLKNLG